VYFDIYVGGIYMEKKYRELLEKFQCDYNRNAEENFAQTLSDNDQVRLFFINENQVFTDGRNIVVDPAEDELFTDCKALYDTGEFLGWPKVVLVDTWNTLRIITRAQTIHECLHIIYTDFPGRHCSDSICDTHNKKMVMGMISNIIEDAYIEAVGCSYYDNMEFYLKFGRVSRLFVNHPSEGTVERQFGKIAKAEREAVEAALKEGKVVNEQVRTNSEILMDYLDYMLTFLLYPMVKQGEPNVDIVDYVEASKSIFLDGSVAPSPKERYEYTSKIYELIAHLIPDDEEELSFESFAIKLGGKKTHDADGSTIGEEKREGRSQNVVIRLFTDLDGNQREDNLQIDVLMSMLQTFAKDKEAALKIVEYSGSFTTLVGGDYDCSVIHKNISIHENHPKINLNLRKAYQNIYSHYKVNIRSYNNRFMQILKAHVTQREEKYQFGSGITSTRLGDIKRRYWYRNVQGEDVPDMAVMLLIDGSGSMYGERRKAAINSAVILHEVLKKQGITHSIVEHRAGFEKPEIDVNILVRFNGNDEEKLNIMCIDAYGDNRDGLALFWAERYMAKHTENDYKLIIVLSDGVPAHGVDDYYPPVSTKDTANAVKKITKRGTDIIGISLDQPGEFDTYDQLSQIYPNLIACNDLSRLTGQLLGIIAKII
jgi:hypothetical protein